MALESQREQWWTGAALCHRSLEFWPQRLRRKVRGRGLSPPTKSPMFSMNLSAPVVAKAEADAGAYTVGQAAHDLELLRSPATDLPTGRVNVGGTGECAGRVHGGPLLGSPSLAHSSSCGVVEPAARHQCLCFVCVVWAPRLHLIVLLPIPPPSYPPTVPPLPLRILPSQMPPTPLACRPSPPLPSTDLGLAAGQPWDRVWQTCPRAASLSHVCHLLCPELPLGPLR